MQHAELIIKLLTLQLKQMDYDLAKYSGEPAPALSVLERLELSLLKVELRLIALENKVARHLNS